MGIKKRIIPAVIELAYECDRKSCTRSGDDKGDFVLDVPVMEQGVKKKIVLCAPCYGRHKAFMEEYDTGTATTEVKEVKDYDPQKDAKLKSLTPDERNKNYQAKLWSLGEDSTIAKSSRPIGLGGKVNEKIMVAYEIWLREQEIRKEVGAAATATA